MATISDLPSHLKEHARRVPDEVFRQLHQGEAWHRLQHVHDKLRAAESLPAEQYRHVTAQADRELKAMPNAQYADEHKRFERLEHDARMAGNHDVVNAWYEARAKLESDHTQVKGVQVAMMDYDRANPVNPQDVAKARKAARDALIKQAIAKATAKLEADQARLRAEIAEFKRERGLR